MAAKRFCTGGEDAVRQRRGRSAPWRRRLAVRGSAWILLSLAATHASPASAQERRLAISAVVQESPVWCWVAAGEMIFRYFRVPNVNPAGDYQCGVVGLLAAGTAAQACASNCALCQVPAGSASYLRYALEEYPRRVAEVTGQRTAATSVRYVRGPLSPVEIRAAIDRGSPVVAGISPAGRPAWQAGSQHVAVVVGYRVHGASLLLQVNDPFPYSGWSYHPYAAVNAASAGRWSYWVDWQAFRSRLGWEESFIVERRGDHRPARRVSRCCFRTAYEARWCPLNLSGPLPEGSDCTCNFGYGNVFYGKACR